MLDTLLGDVWIVQLAPRWNTYNKTYNECFIFSAHVDMPVYLT